MKGNTPAAEARSLSETVGTSDIDQMLHDYVKPAFLKMTPDDRQKVLDLIKQLSDDNDEDD